MKQRVNLLRVLGRKLLVQIIMPPTNTCAAPGPRDGRRRLPIVR